MKRAGLIAVIALSLVSCVPDFARENESPVILRVTKITGTQGGATGTESDFLLSDVRAGNSAFNDNATATFEVIPKNQQLQNAVTGPINDVFVDQYEVRFVRSDGRSQEGVDVPYRFTGSLAVLVPVGNTVATAFIVVRHQAKREPPLTNLASPSLALGGNTVVAGGGLLVSMVAEITFFGHTTSGKAVKTNGRLNVTFADFGD